MTYLPVKVNERKAEPATHFVSITPQGGMRLNINVRQAIEQTDYPCLEVQYDPEARKLRFRPSESGHRLRYNQVSIGKDIARHYTYYRELGVHRTRRHVVGLADDGWWYITKSPRRWRDKDGVG